MGRHSRKDKLKLAVIRYVESELRDYHETRDMLNNALTDIIEKSPMPEEGSSITSRNNVSKPTERNAILLITNKRVQQMEKTVGAIYKVLDMLERFDNSKRRLVQLGYFERRLTPIGIAEELHISERTFYIWRNEIIKLIAVEMGLANAADL